MGRSESLQLPVWPALECRSGSVSVKTSTGRLLGMRLTGGNVVSRTGCVWTEVLNKPEFHKGPITSILPALGNLRNTTDTWWPTYDMPIRCPANHIPTDSVFITTGADRKVRMAAFRNQDGLEVFEDLTTVEHKVEAGTQPEKIALDGAALGAGAAARGVRRASAASPALSTPLAHRTRSSPGAAESKGMPGLPTPISGRGGGSPAGFDLVREAERAISAQGSAPAVSVKAAPSTPQLSTSGNPIDEEDDLDEHKEDAFTKVSVLTAFGGAASPTPKRRASVLSPKGGDQAGEQEDYFDFAVVADTDEALMYEGASERPMLSDKYAPAKRGGDPIIPAPVLSARRKYQMISIGGQIVCDSGGNLHGYMDASDWSCFPTVGVPQAAITSGKYYYELHMLRGERKYIQIGWGSPEMTPTSGNGVGDDGYSWAYDGQRQRKWNGGCTGTYGAEWEDGDVICCAVDYDGRSIMFGLNGKFDGEMGVAFKNVDFHGRPVFPAFSGGIRGDGFHAKFRLFREQQEFSGARELAGYRPVGELLTSKMVAEELRADMVATVNSTSLPVDDAMRLQMTFVADLVAQRDRLDEFVEAEMAEKVAKKHQEHTGKYRELLGDARTTSHNVKLMMSPDEMAFMSDADAAAAVKSLSVRDDLQRAAAEAAMDLTRDSACIDIDRALMLLNRLEATRFSNVPFCKEEDDEAGGEAKPIKATAKVLTTILKFVTGRLPPAEELMQILPMADAVGPALTAVGLEGALGEEDEEGQRRPWLLDQVLSVIRAAQRWSVGVGLHPLQSLKGMSNRTMEKYFGVKGSSVRLLSRAVWGANPPFVLPAVDRALIGFFALMQGDLASGLCRVLGIPRVMLTQNTVQLTLLHNESIRNSLTRVLLRRMPTAASKVIMEQVRELASTRPGPDAALPMGLSDFEEVKLLRSVAPATIESALGLLAPVDKVRNAIAKDTGKAAERKKGAAASAAAQATLAVVKFAATRMGHGISTHVGSSLTSASASVAGAAGRVSGAASSAASGAGNINALLSADIAGAEGAALGAVGSAAGAVSAGVGKAQGALASLGMITDFLGQGGGDEIFAKRLKDPKFLAVTLGGILMRGNPGELLTTIPVFVQALVQNEPKLVAALGVIQHFIALMQARLKALEDVTSAAAAAAESHISTAASAAGSAQSAAKTGMAAASSLSATAAGEASAGAKALAVSRVVALELGKRQEHIMQLLESVLPAEHHSALTVIDAILSLARKDISGVRKLALQFGGFNKDRLETIINTVTGLVEQMQKAGIDTSSPGAAAGAAVAAAKAAASVALDAAKDKAKEAVSSAVDAAKSKLAAKFESLPLVNGRLSDQAIDLLYDAFDTDGGGISFDEFVDFAANAALPLSNERAKRIFAELDVNGTDNVLDRAEFKAGIHILLREITEAALAAMGLSWEVLMYGLGVLVVLLVIMLVFVLLGVQAMSGGSTFGSVINSLMPVAGGAGLAASTDPSQVAKQLREKATALKQRITDAIKSMQPKD